MKKTTIFIALLGVAALIAGALVLLSLTQPIPEAPTREKTPTAKPAQPHAPLPSDEASGPVPAPPAPPSITRGEPPKIPPEILARMQDPQARAKVGERMKQDIRTMYADILAGLSPQDADRLVQALVEEKMSRAEKMLSQGPPTAVEDVQREVRESDQRLEAAVGKELFDIYKKGSQSAGERRLVRDFSASVSASGMSLTPEQTSTLVSLLAEQRAAARQTAVGQMTAPAAGDTSTDPAQQIARRQKTLDAAVQANDAKVIEQARQFLSPEQVGALQFYLSSQGGKLRSPNMPPAIPGGAR